MDQRKQHAPGNEESVPKGKGSDALIIKEKKHRVKARNQDRPCKRIYYVDKPNPPGLGFWVIM